MPKRKDRQTLNRGSIRLHWAFIYLFVFAVPGITEFIPFNPFKVWG